MAIRQAYPVLTVRSAALRPTFGYACMSSLLATWIQPAQYTGINGPGPSNSLWTGLHSTAPSVYWARLVSNCQIMGCMPSRSKFDGGLLPLTSRPPGLPPSILPASRTGTCLSN